MRIQKLILLVGGVLAALAFWIGTSFAPTIQEAVSNLNRPVPESPLQLVVFIIGTLAVYVGYSLTMVSLLSFPMKHYWKRRQVWESVRFYSLDSPFGARFLAFSKIASAFACGVFSYVLEERQVATILAIAGLPTVLQYIELIGPPVNPINPTGSNLVKVPDS